VLDSLRAQFAAGDGPIEEKGRILARELTYSVRSEVEYRRGNTGEALRHIEKTDPASLWFAVNPGVIYCQTYERYKRAQLLELAGREHEALRWYGTIGSDLFEAIYVAPKHLRMGQIYSKIGDIEKAEFHYRRFLNLWSGCDSEFRPLVEEARRGLEEAKARL
jgi:hypothetical protein